MSNSEDSELTDLARFFLEPSNTTHRQYEALRAYFVEHLPSAEAARRFGYTPGSFRVLCHEFRRNPRADRSSSPLSKAHRLSPRKSQCGGLLSPCGSKISRSTTSAERWRKAGRLSARQLSL